MTKNYIIIANKLKQEGKLEAAIASYRQGIELNPNFYWYHYKLGEILTEAGNLQEAIDSYSQAIKLNSNSALPYYNLALIFIESNQVEVAIENLETAIKLEPNPSQFRCKLEEILAEQKKQNIDKKTTLKKHI